MKTIASGLNTPLAGDAYYGTAVENAATYTDWGKIAAGIGESVAAQGKLIADHKELLDKNSNDLMNSIYVNPLTQDTGPNGIILKIAQGAQTLLQQNRNDFQTGKKSEHDYLLFQQNIKTDVDNATSLSSKFTAAAKTISDGVAAGTHLAEGQFNAGKIQELSAFANTQPAYGVDGHLVLYRTKKNPETGIVETTNEMYSPLNAQAMLQPLAKYDVNGAIAQSFGAIGNLTLELNDPALISKAGSLTKLFGPDILEKVKSDPKLAHYTGAIESANKALDSYTQSIVSDPRHLSSILQTELAYHNWTEDLATAKANPKMIYRKADPLGGPPIMVTDDSSPHYKEQLAEATKLVRDRMIGHFKQGNEISAVSAVTAPPVGTPKPKPEKEIPQATPAEIKSFVKTADISKLMDFKDADQTANNLLPIVGDLGLDVNSKGNNVITFNKTGSTATPIEFKLDAKSIPKIEQYIKGNIDPTKVDELAAVIEELKKRQSTNTQQTAPGPNDAANTTNATGWGQYNKPNTGNKKPQRPLTPQQASQEERTRE
jgi:hypothetical protein